MRTPDCIPYTGQVTVAETIVNPPIDPTIVQGGYTGGFNPYQTGYFGY